jgi:hypothetical protein
VRLFLFFVTQLKQLKNWGVIQLKVKPCLRRNSINNISQIILKNYKYNLEWYFARPARTIAKPYAFPNEDFEKSTHFQNKLIIDEIN